jgi:hypothetical protein
VLLELIVTAGLPLLTRPCLVESVGQPEPLAPSTDVAAAAARSDHPRLTELIASGMRRSRTFARLSDTLAKHRAIVHVSWSTSLWADLTGALLNHVGRGADGTRYLRVVVRRGKADDAIIATIAHELQHAIEVVETGASDIEGAYPEKSQYTVVHETVAAKRIGETVRRELAAFAERHRAVVARQP